MSNCLESPYKLPTVSFVGGSTQELAFHTYFENNGRPLSMSGCVGYFSIVEYLDRSLPLLSKTMTITESPVDATDNILRVELEPSDTVDMVGKFIYQVTIKQQPQAWSKEARDWAEGSGLIKGDEHGNKQYESYCSREQMVQFLYRFKDIVK